jgi:branched-chain amino acid transport system ATP-binding protein
MLRIERLSYDHGGRRVLRDVDLEVREGEVVSVLGASGAGKSTLLRIVSRLLRPGAGKIVFQGADLGRMHPHQVVALGIAHVPEGRPVFPGLTVLENLRMGSHLPAARRDRARNLERVFALFPPLAERRKQPGGALSGGERQMLAIARGLMSAPRLLLLDEPSLGLSPLLARNVFEAVATIHRQGTTILLAGQDVVHSLGISNRAYVLEMGSVVLAGTGPELVSSTHVKRAYLGA